MYKKVVFLVLVSLMFFLVCCEEDNPNKPSAEDVIINPNAHILEEEEMSNSVIEVQDNMLIVDSNSIFADYSVGDILVLGITPETPYGSLRQIESIENNSNNLIIETSLASLTQVIQNGHLSEDLSLQASNIDSLWLTDGVVRDRSSDEELDLDINLVLYDSDGNYDTLDDQVKIDGEFNLSTGAKANLELNISAWKITDFEFIVEKSQGTSLNISAGDDINFETYERKIGHITYIPSQFFVGPVPINITAQLDIILKVSTSGTVTFEYGYSEEVTSRSGAKYQDNAWEEVDECSKIIDVTETDIESDIAAECSMGTKYSIMLYGEAGPYIEGTGYVQAHAEAEITESETALIASIDAGLSVKLGFYMDVFSHEIFDMNREWEVYNENIYENEWIIESGDTTSNPTFYPEPGLFGESQTVQISCANSNADIYYTLDGSEPDNTSTLYSTPFEISETTTVKAIAYKTGLDASSVVNGNYEIDFDAVSLLTITTEKGNPNGHIVGTGLMVYFSVDYELVKSFGEFNTNQFEYKVGKYVYDEDAEPLDIPVLLEETDWFITESDEVLINKHTTPSLEADFDSSDDDAQQLTFTRITGRIYNSSNDNYYESTMEFAVKEGLHPNTVIYPQKLYGLGDYHYKDYVADNDLENYPHLNVNGPIPVIYATKFFKDLEGQNVAVNSTNFRMFLKCGYFGQYGVLGPDGHYVLVFSNSPYDDEVEYVLNESDNMHYYSKIVAYDIRFDNAPFDFHGQSRDSENLVTHEDGTQWLRIPINEIWKFSDQLELANMDNGLHKFEVSAVDLQDEYDPTPCVYEFYLTEYIPPSNREGVIVFDATNFPTWSTSRVYADSVYLEVLSSYSNVDFIKRNEILASNYLAYQQCSLSYSDLQNYKTIIYREEAVGTEGLIYDYEAIKLYLDNGGNLILSYASNFGTLNGLMVNSNRNMFRDYFGIDLANSAIYTIQQSPSRPYIIGATPTSNISLFNNLPELNLYLGHSHNAVISLWGGLRDIAYFSEDYATPGDNLTQVIYRSKIKDIDAGDPYAPQDLETYNQFNNLPIAVGKVTDNNKCFAFGFPLSHMEKTELIQLFEQLLND